MPTSLASIHYEPNNKAWDEWHILLQSKSHMKWYSAITHKIVDDNDHDRNIKVKTRNSSYAGNNTENHNYIVFSSHGQ